MLAANWFQVNRIEAVRRSCITRSQLPRALVNANVFFRGGPPGEVLAHAVAHQLLPGSLITEGSQGLLDGQQQSLAVVIGELEPGALASARVPVLNGVVETAGRAYDGYGSVFQAIDLVQAAGFVPGRHKEHVAAAFNLVRNRVIVGHLDCD